MLAACFTAILTEVLSPFHLLRRGPVMAGWILPVAAAIFWMRPRFTRPKLSWRFPEAAIVVSIIAIAIPVGIAAVLSPPNSTDAMAYHLPRVLYWAQAGSVRFFPTPYLNQIMLQPLAEYLMLHQYLLTSGDHFINLIAYGAFLASIVGVSALAEALGLGRTGQALAAFFCATLPDGILQASGAKNDWLLAFFLVAAIYFAVRRDLPFAGFSLGLALATKATGYLFGPPAILAALILGRNAFTWKTAAWFAAGVLAINTPQYLRNVHLSGSPLGYDSAQGDGFFRWRNEHPGPGATASNVLRSLSDQLGSRSERWNRAVYNGVLRIHEFLGLDPQSPDTTWRWSRYMPPRNSNHEADANNRWHLLLLVIATGLVLRRRKSGWVLYACALLTGFLLFCFYLKWQPYQARLELPLFVLAAPLGAYLLDSIRPRAAVALICLFLLSGARLPALQNWVRPLKGPHSLFVTARDDNYFSDMTHWNNRSSYLEAVDRTAHSGCQTVGLDISENQLEYPFQVLLREREPGVRFVHTGVQNSSARYADPAQPAPCAVLCLDCIGNQPKIGLYQSVGPPQVIGRFLLFQK